MIRSSPPIKTISTEEYQTGSITSFNCIRNFYVCSSKINAIFFNNLLKQFIILHCLVIVLVCWCCFSCCCCCWFPGRQAGHAGPFREHLARDARAAGIIFGCAALLDTLSAPADTPGPLELRSGPRGGHLLAPCAASAQKFAALAGLSLSLPFEL